MGGRAVFLVEEPGARPRGPRGECGIAVSFRPENETAIARPVGGSGATGDDKSECPHLGKHWPARYSVVKVVCEWAI